MAKVIAVKPKTRGRPATGRAPFVGVRMPAALTDALTDALNRWIASRSDPKRSLSEAIRIGLKDWLTGLGLMSQYGDVEALKQKIAELKPATSGKPSPAKGMAMLRRGRAKSELAKAKNKWAKASKST